MVDQPLNFDPPRIYVLKDVWNNPRAARRAERVARACPDAETRTFTYAELPDIVVEEGWDHFGKMGTMQHIPPPIPILGLFEFDAQEAAHTAARMRAAYKGKGNFNFARAAGGDAFTFFTSSLNEIRPNPEHICRPQWRLHQGVGCPHRCAYCGLGGYIINHLNIEDYIDHLSQLLRHNSWQKTWLLDDVMDVLTLEPQIDILGPLMRFFQSTGDRYLILHTKSDRVEAMLNAGAPNNTIIAWSLSGPTQSRRLELETGTTETRIEAARQCQEIGITVRYKFKPIIPVPNWREEATYTIDRALSRTKPDNLSLTSLMWMQVEALKSCIPEDLLDPEFLHAAEEAKEDMRNIRVAPFPDNCREQIYRHHLSEIRIRDAHIPVTLCTESLDMWKRLSDDLGVTPGDYVCGCGAGATPNLQLLETSPWQDAQNPRNWDGMPVALNA